MPTRAIKYLTKSELLEANRRAIEAGYRAIDPIYAEQLIEGFRYPVFMTLPWERHGWVRCQIGTATSIPAHDYKPVFVDVPQSIFDNLSSVEVPEDIEVTQ